MSEDRTIKSNGFVFKITEEIIYIGYVILGFYLAFLLKFDMNPSPTNIEPFFDSIKYIIITTIVIFYLYDIVSTLKKSLFENALTIGLSLILIDIITVAIVFFNRGFAFPRSIFIIGFIIQFILIFITKFLILQILKLRRKKQNIFIIASKEEGEELAKKILLDKHNIDRIKYMSHHVDGQVFETIKKSDKIYIGSTIKNKDKSKIIEYCIEKDKTVYIIPSLFEISLVGFKTTQIEDKLIFKIDDMGLTFEQRFLKRIMDIVISTIGLVLVSPILIIISMVIKIYDRGPILFKQERVTENNKRFNLYKFRTMIVDAEKHTGPVLATDKDPRITPLGSFLRSTRIDELPQLFNVLKGDMSIVGPRPERPFFVDQFNEEVDGFKYRVFVKAGVTGLAQILGSYGTDPETKAKYDLYYIKNYSLFLDIKIIFNTIKIMFIKSSSQGISKDKKLEEICKEINIEVYEKVSLDKVK